MGENEPQEKEKEIPPPLSVSPPAPDPAARNPLAYDNKTLYIYCPSELAMEFIDFANKEFGGKQYIALKELLRSWREMRHIAYMIADLRDMQEELAIVKERLTRLEEKAYEVVDKEITIPTMGEGLKVKKDG